VSPDEPSHGPADLFGARPRPTRTIEIALLAALVVVTGTGVASYFSVRSLEALSEARRRAFEISRALERVLSLATDAETGQRGYLITGHDEYLEPYRLARGRITLALNDLRRRTIELGLPLHAIDQLETLTDEKFRELTDTIGVRRDQGFDAAAKIVLTDRGQEAMEAIRQVASEVRQSSDEAVARASAALHRQIIVTMMLGAANVIALACIFLAAALVRRQFTEKARREASLSGRLVDRRRDRFGA
jgi:methyl-accepting chemotaxis protein